MEQFKVVNKIFRYSKSIVSWRGVFWQGIHLTVAGVLIWALSIIQAEKWGPELFGWFSYLYTLIGVIGIVGDFGIEMVLTKYTAIQKKGILKSFYVVKFVSIFTCVIISVFVIMNLERRFHLAFVFLIIGIIFQSVISFLNGSIRGIERLDVEAKIGLIQKLLFVLPSISVILFLDKKIDFICFLYGLSNIIAFLLTLLFLSRLSLLYNAEEEISEWHIFQQSWPIFIINLLSFLSLRIDVMFAKWLNHANVVGIYSAAFRIIEGLSFFATAYTVALFPRLAKTNNIFSIGKHVIFSSWILGCAGVLMMIILLVSGLDLMRILLGNNYEQSTQVLRIISISLPALFLGNLFGNVLIVMDRQKIYSLIISIGIIISLVIDLWTVPSLKAAGVSWGMLGRTVITCILTGIITFRSCEKFSST